MKLLLISFVLIYTCDFAYGKGKIVGGYEIKIDQVPYQVALLYYGQLRCGGVVISPYYALTAAHCTYQITQAPLLSIRTGSSFHANNGTIYEVGKIYVHPNFDKFLYDYDASILLLMKKIQFNQLCQPIQLPYPNEAILPGSFVATSGWGLTNNENESTDVLRMVELTVVRQLTCYKAYAESGGVTTRMVCASAEGKDACAGDSGGPLVDLKSKKLVGLVSFGPNGECAVNGIPGVYTRVAALRRWIREVTRI